MQLISAQLLLVLTAESFLYALADAAVAVDSATGGASSDSANAAAQKNGGWFGFISDAMEFVLKILKDGLSAVHVPYSYGCLPTLATIPVWIGLYQVLSNVANEGLLTEGFFWIPSLGGPTTFVARQSGSGISWIFPFVDGHPPLGWYDTAAYFVLPVLLIRRRPGFGGGICF